MARWPFKDNELPERLRGKSPEEIEAALQEAESYRTETEAKLTASQQAQSEVEQLRAKVAELEARPAPQPEPQPQPQPQPGPTSFLIDEDRAFNERVAPYAQLSLNTAAVAARISARDQALADSTTRVIWRKYEKEIDDVMKNEPPVRRAHPQTWMNAVTFVAGQHIKDIAKLREDGTDFFAEESRSPGTPPGGGEPENEIKLTPQELEIAKNMKLKPEEMLAQKKAFAGGSTLVANLPERSQ